MARALDLARPRLGQVWPNPAVGCVIADRDGTVLGHAATAPGGRPHAEPQALAQAGVAARDATAYVTLEPCAHQGQTPPCAQALIDAGIARVVIALGDPDPRVDGGGIALLRAAGIETEIGLMAEAARDLNCGFLHRIRTGRPWVTLKLATTLDGRIATKSGESRWITGPLARSHVHDLRASHDAVMVGGGTMRADDPMLDVRRDPTPPRQPVRVVVSQSGRLPADGRLARTAAQQPVWLIHDQMQTPTTGEGITGIPVAATCQGLDLEAALGALGQAGVTRVLCEGGGRLAAGLIRAGLVNELVVIFAGSMIGAEGRPGVGPMGLDVLAEAPRMTLVEHRPIGGDLLTRWRPGPEGTLGQVLAPA